MILLYPIVLAAALFIASKKAHKARGGWPWFAGWTAAGALMTFSFLTGFSIGLFVLPVAALTLLWVASHAPGTADAFGLFVGIGVTLLVIPMLNGDAGPGWLFAGLAFGFAGIAAYVKRDETTARGFDAR
jgi:hypothetical protein